MEKLYQFIASAFSIAFFLHNFTSEQRLAGCRFNRMKYIAIQRNKY